MLPRLVRVPWLFARLFLGGGANRVPSERSATLTKLKFGKNAEICGPASLRSCARGFDYDVPKELTSL